MRFFRPLRKDSVDRNEIYTYSLYALGEISFIVLGILLAFQIDNWNEDRKNAKLRQGYIKSLITDLKKDSIAIKDLLNYAESDIQIIGDYKKRLSHPEVSIDTLYQIARFEFNPFIYPNLSFNQSTYISLTSTGNINLFDGSISELLIELNTSQKSTNKTLEWSAQMYQTYIGEYSINYPMNIPGTILKNSPLNEFIWKNTKDHEFAAKFNGIVGLKLNHQSVVKESMAALLMKTKFLLKKLEQLQSRIEQ
ncbi:MAG: DUF6090 family protein [Bacteroidota bacterium]